MLNMESNGFPHTFSTRQQQQHFAWGPRPRPVTSMTIRYALPFLCLLARARDPFIISANLNVWLPKLSAHAQRHSRTPPQPDRPAVPVVASVHTPLLCGARAVRACIVRAIYLWTS